MVNFFNSKNLRSLKADGLVHRTWTTALITPFPGTYYISPYTAVVEGNGASWSSSYPVFATFYTKQYFQVFTLCKDDSIEYYCNVITPMMEFHSSILFIDLDIDVEVTPDSIRVLDLDEFEERRSKYSIQWQKKAIHASEQLVQMAEKRHGVFSLQSQLSFRAYAENQQSRQGTTCPCID